ncbi:MAG: hypothetical protein MUD16_02665 [Desulfobacterales bacterium]|jgi:hypothetical protein|nr:hypothetical protein [Desulfobacterales bacterium]
MRTLFGVLICSALCLGWVVASAGAGERPPEGLDVYVLGQHAYVAAGKDGLFVVDIRSQADLGRIATVPTPGEAKGAFAAGSFAYVAAGAAGLHILDIRNPASPLIVGSVDTPGDARDVYVFSDYALVADGIVRDAATGVWCALIHFPWI